MLFQKKRKKRLPIAPDEAISVLNRLIDNEPYFNFYEVRALKFAVETIEMFKEFEGAYKDCEDAIDYICLTTELHEMLSEGYGRKKEKK